jgi:hypothetical protein
MPAKLGRADVEFVRRSLDRRNAPFVPTRTAEQIRLKATSGQLEEERRLDRRFLDLLVEGLERLRVTIERHFDAHALGESESDLPANEPHRILIDNIVVIDVAPDPRHADAYSEPLGSGGRRHAENEQSREAQERSSS